MPHSNIPWLLESATEWMPSAAIAAEPVTAAAANLAMAMSELANRAANTAILEPEAAIGKSVIAGRGFARHPGRAGRVAPVADILGLDLLLAQMMLALGLAMVIGNGFAIWRNARGRPPATGRGNYRPGRAWFLLATGALISIWAAAGLLT